ncbi:hypothetical protein V9T40_000070 [Parthenolecanium corni]|uniref:Uncharacterized protein n=1 Tax=Parthenolecanium corni TaxID=536013 RepID=A0AAN9Y2T3_9HEMI
MDFKTAVDLRKHLEDILTKFRPTPPEDTIQKSPTQVSQYDQFTGYYHPPACPEKSPPPIQEGDSTIGRHLGLIMSQTARSNYFTDSTQHSSSGISPSAIFQGCGNAAAWCFYFQAE